MFQSVCRTGDSTAAVSKWKTAHWRWTSSVCACVASRSYTKYRFVASLHKVTNKYINLRNLVVDVVFIPVQKKKDSYFLQLHSTIKPYQINTAQHAMPKWTNHTGKTKKQFRTFPFTLCPVLPGLHEIDARMEDECGSHIASLKILKAFS